MKYNLKKSLSVPLSVEEQQLEDRLPFVRPSSKSTDVESIRQAATQTLKSMRGGFRPGSGRKARSHVRTTLLLSPEIRSKLELLAQRHGNLSLAAEVAIRKAKIA